MPLVRISMLRGRTQQQKEDLAASIAQAMVEIAKADPSTIEVLYDEYEPGDWIKFGPNGARHASWGGSPPADRSR